MMGRWVLASQSKEGELFAVENAADRVAREISRDLCLAIETRSAETDRVLALAESTR